MILNELVLQNVGTFSGRHTIELTPPSTEQPIVLIGGLNGAGKTTVLEAIHLAFYGTLAQPTGRRKGSYENYLRGLIHRGASPSAVSAVELQFSAHEQGAEHTYRIVRSWGGGKGPVRETLEVDVDGRHDKALVSTWGEHVENFLPRGIAGLFFFDGEQIEALADMHRSREVLGSALSSLLGLDLVDRLSTDLAVLRRRHRVNQVPEALKAGVEEMRLATVEAHVSETEAVQAAGSVRVELERAEKLQFEKAEKYRSLGGELLDKRAATESALEVHREGLIQVDNDLRDEAGDVAPLLQVAALLGDLEQQVRDEADSVEQRILADALGQRDSSVLELLRSTAVSSESYDQVARFMEDDREHRSQSSSGPAISGLASLSGIDFLRSTALPTSDRRLESLLERRSAIRDDLDQLERVLVAMPDPESLAGLRSELDAANSELARTQATLTMVEEGLTSSRAERVKREAKYESELDKLAQANLAIDDDLRIVSHVDKVTSTLENLRAAATRKYLGRIGDLVLEALQRLLRKESLVAAVTIDPDTHTVELAGHDGSLLMANQLSAGERQLLAVSLLWGLARASGQPLPVVVDTPLGRLDGTHREYLVDRYFPYASHQVVLLSTDTEIDEPTYRRIKDFVGRSYTLSFDDQTSSTSVEPGYFWE